MFNAGGVLLHWNFEENPIETDHFEHAVVQFTSLSLESQNEHKRRLDDVRMKMRCENSEIRIARQQRADQSLKF